MNMYVVFFDDFQIYRKAKYSENTPIEKFIKALCDGEIGEEGDGWCTIPEDDYEDWLEYYDFEEDFDIEYYDLT